MISVALHTLEDFFDDLDRVKAEGESPMVRTEILTLKRDEGGGVTDVRIVSGFICDGYFYELTLPCGEIWMGDKDPEAIKTAKENYRQIELKCQELSLKHGGGQWQLQ